MRLPFAAVWKIDLAPYVSGCLGYVWCLTKILLAQSRKGAKQEFIIILMGVIKSTDLFFIYMRFPFAAVWKINLFPDFIFGFFLGAFAALREMIFP